MAKTQTTGGAPVMRATMTVTEAAAFLGIGRTAAYEAVQRGEIPSLRIGGRLVIPRVPLLALVGMADPC